ncbi:MAG: hypothetical protein KatS3mg031_2017 [Chitinophagales bacterium]|nr:MAG: hypothetical protein KatS3mg031_2017 [Chitinophagales bacterium]
MRNTALIQLVVKVALFALFFYLMYRFLLFNVSWREVSMYIGKADYLFLGAAIFFMFLRFITLGFKFYLATRALSTYQSLWSFLINELKLLFMEFVVPVPDAEDVFRALFLKMQGLGLSDITKVIIAMRVSGMITLFLLLSGFWFFEVFELPGISAKVGLVVVSFLLAGLFTHRFWLKMLAGMISYKPLRLLLGQTVHDGPGFAQYISLVGMTLLYHMFSSVVIYCLASSMGVSLNPLILLLIIPLMSLSFIVPLSVQGLGLPEAVLLFALLQLRVPAEIASAISIIHLMIYIGFIVCGAVVFGLDKTYRLETLWNQYYAFKAKYLST